MKKLIVLISLLAPIATGSYAQSVLKVHLSDNSRFNIALNGRRFNREGQSITVGDLPPGTQYMKIYGLTPDRRGRLYEELVYEGTVRTRYGMITNFEYDPYNHTMDIHLDDMNSRGPQAPAMNRPDNNNDAGYNDAGNNQPGNNNIQDNNQPLPDGSPAASPLAADKTSTLTDAETEQLKTRVEAAPTDTKKTTILKEALKNERLTTYDVSYMMDWFIFEASKVDFAKWAYKITTDREFYTDLDAKLKNKDAKEDLASFIRSRK